MAQDTRAGPDHRLTGVADGAVNATSNDAVNGSQLSATNQNVTDLGDLVSVNEANIAGNTASITNIGDRVTTNETNIANISTDVSNVGGRVSVNETNIAGNTTSITNIDDRVTTNETDIASLLAGGGGLTQQDQTSRVVTIGAQTDGTAINVANNTGKARAVTGVAAGVADNDAVNVLQLRSAVNGANDYTEQRVQQLESVVGRQLAGLEFNLNDYRNESQAGIASVMATTQLRYDNRPGKISIGAGVGGFQGQMSVASGVGYTSEDQRVRLNAGFGYNPGRSEATWGAGASFTLN